jgi:serine/threonine-protein kinase
VVSLSPGSTFHERYEVVRCIKAGGMGAVYEVIHKETRRRRALKLMLPTLLDNVDMRARFELEATVAADIESEHIVETFDAGVDGATGAPFLVMELLRGEDLAAMIARRGALPPGDAVRLLAQAASALDKTHAAGVVHRDLKPDNLFVTRRDDGSPKVKILDFGIAKVVSESGRPAAKTRVLGTPLYMSPEQVRGDGRIGPRADLHALAQIAFTLVVGKPYWAEEHDALPLYALMTKIVGGCEEPALARAARYGGAVTPAFDGWFRRATRILPEDRFPSAATQIGALAEALGVPPARRDGLGPLESDPPAGRRDEALPRHAADGSTAALTDAADDTVVTPEATLPNAPLRTESLPPASRTHPEASTVPPGTEGRRRGDVNARVAWVAAVAAILAAAVALNSRVGPPPPAALAGTVSPPVPAAAPAPSVEATALPTSAPAETTAATTGVSPGPAPSAARPPERAAEPHRAAPRPAVAPTSEATTRPKRSLD